VDSTSTYEIIRMMILAVLKGSGPILAVALMIGLVIAFIQALTQIQEMTLTFVPKIVAIFITLALSLPFMFGTLSRLSDTVFDLISSGGV
jgi:flagellar biosynthetic protein FliQ